MVSALNNSFSRSLGSLFLTLAALLLMASPALTASEQPYTPAAGELKKMSIFLSNFTEIRFMNFTVGRKGGEGTTLIKDGASPDLVRFGIWHNYRNNFNDKIRTCTVEPCTHGSLTIDGASVAATIKKYFDLDLKNQSVSDSQPVAHFDGRNYHFEGADGEATYFAQVEKVFQQTDGTLRMTGYLYNADDSADRPATFEALAKRHTFEGRKTWAILSLTQTNVEN